MNNKTNTSLTLSVRNNYDKITNRNGKELLQLCRSLSLYIANGRIRGDSFGRYTYSSSLGSSTVDYAITDLDPFSLRAFTVKQQTPFSDHNQIKIYLKRPHSKQPCPNSSKLYNITTNYRWMQSRLPAYQEAMSSHETQEHLNSFLAHAYPSRKEGVNLATKHITNIFHYVAQQSSLPLQKPNPKKRKQEKWFDSECKSMRKKLRQLSNQKHRDPDNQDLRIQYGDTVKEYKQTLRFKKEHHLKNQINLIEDSINSNSFWDHWRTLNKNNNTNNDLAIQDGDIWINHFKDLYQETHITPKRDQLQDKLNQLETIIKDYQNPLDYEITEKELDQKLKNLKCRKACGPDGILNEMLKHTDNKFKSAILKLLNLVLKAGFFPEIWNDGLIRPIFKSGDKTDPQNYRGICINSCLGKVLCSILNSRIIDFLTEHNVLSNSQIGFLPKFRTTDHIFTLNTLIDNYVHKNNTKIYACFVDFQKAFDSVWHNGLFLKLLESGIGGNTYNLIKSMYTNGRCSIKIGTKKTESFFQRRGVRQGCNLSPTLFNIYINELSKQIENSPAPGLKLQDTEIKCLFYADDLVLLSPTKEGLQQHLSELDKYCQTWALTVNQTKTNVLIFQKRSRPQRDNTIFTIGNNPIKETTNYTYLGLKISNTGNFNLAVNELRDKAKRAFYAIKKSIQIELPVTTWLKIFQSIIEPIALYGSEVWGTQIQHDWTKWDKHAIEILHTQFCKSILQVQRKAPNSACRAELGQYPLILKIQKRALNFWNHIKTSDPLSFSYKALCCQELNPQRSPLCLLVLRLGEPSPTQVITQRRPQPQNSRSQIIRPNQIIMKEKEKYRDHWAKLTKSQNKLETYVSLNRQYTVANYLTTVSDKKMRKTLTKYRLSEHNLAVEVGRHRQTWLPREERLCSFCNQGTVETELHFLIYCNHNQSLRDYYFDKITQIFPEFHHLNDLDRLSVLLGEREDCCRLAAKYVSACHELHNNMNPLSQITNI